MKTKVKDTLLLIGSADSDRSKLHSIFESNYYLLEAETAAQGMMLVEQNRQCIAAVLADIPLENGDQMRQLVSTCHTGDQHEVPVVALIVPAHTGEREEFAFLLGVDDVVLKPYTTLAIQRRIQVLVDLYLNRWNLEKLVEEQSKTIQHASQAMVDGLSAVIEHRSSESGNHVLRIRRFTHIILEEVARSCPEYALTETLIDTISSAAALHDIGKISIPDAILNKPGRLTPEEFEVMKTHTTIGSELISRMEDMGDEAYQRYSYNISLYHHERWDGGGYPAGLAGDQIPICAQVVGLADAFDALTTPRVYKPAYPCNKALNMIVNGECGIFSPKLLECFKRSRTQLFRLAQEYADGYSPKSDSIQVPLPDPIRQVYQLDANQLSQLKYQTLLHYINDMVMEVDLDHKVFHIVHNPDPDLISRLNDPTEGQFFWSAPYQGIHPEDAQRVSEINKQLLPELFNHHLRKYSVSYRIFSPLTEVYIPYTMTMLRINTDNPDQRLLLAVFHKETGDDLHAPIDTEKLDAAAFYGMTGSTLCCFTDENITISQGADTLQALTEYTQEELYRLFGDSFVNLVILEDRHLLDPLRTDQNSNIRYTELRILRKDKPPLWVNCRSRFLIRADGAEYLYLTLVDISVSKEKQQQLENAIARNQTLIDCSESVIFEWNLRTDRISCSDKLMRRFGYELKDAPFAEQLGSASRFHPDDLPLVRQAAQNLTQKPGTDVVDTRIVNSEGRYLWSRIRAVSLAGDDGKPAYILGIIYDIHELKNAALSLKRQAERDSLTKLLNKASCQQAVNTWLEECQPGSRAALMILDMDNFKLINDTHGHLYGDAVLTQVSSTLRSLFRSDDLIGRIGGDEFLIFMKDIPSRELVGERCQLLVDTISLQLSRLMPGLPVSVSIGAALLPSHGQSYNDLFRNADTALYSAKHKGKNQYRLYDPKMKYDTLTDVQITRIDSDENPVMSNDSLVRFVFRCLYESRDIDATIEELLAFIGVRFDVSRVYIFENNNDNTACSNTFEWCGEGISPEKDNLQNISYITDIPGWPDVYDERGVLYCSDINDLPPTAQEILEPQGVKSMLQCAIMDRGVFRGYVGFDECSGNRLWTQEQVSLLEFLAEVFAVFLIKQRALDKKAGEKG